MVSMRRILTVLLFAIALGQGQEGRAAGPTPSAPEKSDSYVAKERQTQLDKLMEIGVVREKYNKCKEQKSEDISGCIWEHLSPEEKKEVQKKLTSGEGDKQKKYESVDVNAIQEGGDESLKKLSEYLSKKLREALYGDVQALAKEKKVQVVDHAIFYELFETQVSKNIVGAISSFCMDAVPDLYIVYEDIVPPAGPDPKPAKVKDNTAKKVEAKNALESVRKYNIKSLTDLVQVAPPVEKKGKDKKNLAAKSQGPVPRGYVHWSNCTEKLQDICYGEDIKFEPPKDKEEMQSFNEGAPGDSLFTQADIKNTHFRACQVVDYIKAARQNLMALVEVKKELGIGSDKKSDDIQMQIKNVQEYSGKEEGKKRDDLTTFTSQEVSASGYESATQEEDKKFKEQCASGTLNQAECSKYLAINEDKKKLEAATDETSLRLQAMQAKIDEAMKNDDELKKYLKEEGYTDEQIAQKMKDPNEIRKAIKDHYTTLSETLIKDLKKRREAKVAKKDNQIDAKDDKDKLDKISHELSSQAERFSELTHFNNVISGFIDITDSSGKNSKNSFALEKELKASQYDPTKGKEIDQGYFDQLKKKVEESGVAKGSSVDTGNSAKNIEVKTINESILTYGDDEKKEGTAPPSGPAPAANP